jgi:hypothetical protein
MALFGEFNNNIQYGLYLSASGLVKTGPGVILGIFVNSMSSGTVKVWDNTSAANPYMLNTITLATTDRYIPIGMKFTTGLFVTIGGTADITISYQ